MTTRLTNAAAGRRTLSWIRAHPDEFDMVTFGLASPLLTVKEIRDRPTALRESCGTRACLAGHALLAHGYTLRYDSEEHDSYYATPDGQKLSISEVEDEASALLGLDDNQIFYHYNDTDVVLAKFEQLVIDAETMQAALRKAAYRAARDQQET